MNGGGSVEWNTGLIDDQASANTAKTRTTLAHGWHVIIYVKNLCSWMSFDSFFQVPPTHELMLS